MDAWFAIRAWSVALCFLFTMWGCGPDDMEAHDMAVQGAMATLQWDAVSGSITGYRLYVGAVPHVYHTRYEVGRATSYTVTNLEEDTPYYFAVTAYNAAGESGFSEEVSTVARIPSTSASASRTRGQSTCTQKGTRDTAPRCRFVPPTS
jgi:hypothetical protein